MSCERARKLPDERINMPCRGTTFVFTDGASHLLEQPQKTTEASQTLLPILDGPAPPYDMVLDCIQFAYTGDSTGDYVAPASKFLVRSMVSEEDLLFYPTPMHLRRSYYEYYALLPTSTITPTRGLITLSINQLVSLLIIVIVTQAWKGDRVYGFITLK